MPWYLVPLNLHERAQREAEVTKPRNGTDGVGP